MHMCSGDSVVKDVRTVFWIHLTPCDFFFFPLAVLCLSCELLSGALRLVLYSAGRMTHVSVIQLPHDILLVRPAVLLPSTCQKQTVSLNKLLLPIHN